MKREETIGEISKLVNLDGSPFVAQRASEMISHPPMKTHNLTYHVRLNSGTLIVDLIYDDGVFRHEFESFENVSELRPEEQREFKEAEAYFENSIDKESMQRLFSILS